MDAGKRIHRLLKISLPYFVGNYPLVYYRQPWTMGFKMAKRHKHIQPQSGIEKAFGQAMRKARKKRNMSQMKLYLTTGLDRTFISDLERGIQGPSLRTVFRVAKGLEMSAWELVKLAEESPHFELPISDGE